ncbi:hypothetical protein EV401DRAFT_2084546 [Pisolithus croceorrhizus]|nr:hypothetical protein EV401DRAFT_2084546 [Pisolithus croceorrhizus]
MAAETVVTKRLHVSGLTPSITSTDILHRLSAFGSVKSLDGFGKLDALGDPRPFAYVTLEGKEKDLAKCMNVLSGSTWKGTKLRIGEAKPDYRQRIAYLNSLSPPPPRTSRSNRRQLAFASPTLDTPLSRDDAAKTAGWVVMPSGRVVRPMRMRPERPLEPMHAVGGGQRARGKTSEKVGKKGKKRKVPPSRARSRTIDPTKWDSTYLTGALLETIVAPSSSSLIYSPSESVTNSTAEPRSIELESDEEESNDVYVPSQNFSNVTIEGQSPAQAAPTADFSGSSLRADVDIDIRQETSSALALLNSMFGEADEWGGPESAYEFDGTDGDRTAMVVDTGPGTVGEGNIEEVPRHVSTRVGEARMHGGPSDEEGGNSGEDIEMGDTQPTTVHPSAAATSTNTRTATSEMDTTTAAVPTKTKLKDLFAPREEEREYSRLRCLADYVFAFCVDDCYSTNFFPSRVFRLSTYIVSSVLFTLQACSSCCLRCGILTKFTASFSLLGHLDLDLELEDDMLGGSSIFTTAMPSTHVVAASSGPPSGVSSNHQVGCLHPPVKKSGREGDGGITLDSTRPLLFPLIESLPYSYSGTPNSNLTSGRAHTHARGEPRSVVFPRLHVNIGGTPRNLLSLPDTVRRFERSPDSTEQSIREAWERDKGEVTSAWKKAWKEARGKKRGGTDAGGVDV